MFLHTNVGMILPTGLWSKERKSFLSQKFLDMNEENSDLEKPSDLLRGHACNERPGRARSPVSWGSQDTYSSS